MSHPWHLKILLQKFRKTSSLLDRFLFAILGIGLVLLTLFLATLFWFSLTNRSVTTLLPAEKTIATLELEDLTLPPRLSQETVLDLLGLTAVVKGSFGLDMATLQHQLPQGRMGLALLDDGTPENKLVLFLRSPTHGKALAFMKTLALPDETLTIFGDKKHPIYSYPKGQAFVFGFVGPYLFVAKQPETIQLIQQVDQQKLPSLDSDLQFQKSLANLPRQAWARGYLNLQALSFGAGSQLGQTVAPLKNILNHLTLTVRKEYNGFHFNTLLSVQPDALALSKGESAKSSPALRGLADSLGSKKLAAYLGGSNLSAEWQNTLETLSQLNPSYGIILEGILRAQVSKVFGDDISLGDDLYPLFEGEYAVALERLEGDALGVKLLLKHSDRTFAEIKLKKMLAGFRMLAAQFSPRVKSVTLPDGTESKELVADATRLLESDETYKGTEIHCLEITDSPYGLCTAVTDQLVILSNHSESIRETIDLGDSPKFVLSQSQAYRQSLSNLSAVNDEVTFVDLGNATPLLKAIPAAAMIGNLLDPFEAVTWVKHVFTDGVSTEGYLLLK